MCVCAEQGRLVIARTTWRQPCMNFLRALRFAASKGFKEVKFEIDRKMVADKLHYASYDLSELGYLIAECRKLLAILLIM